MGLYEVGFQKYDVQGVEYCNVIGVVNPEAEKVVVIGFHYDMWGDFENGGADDNASAVAVGIELARSMVDGDLPDYRFEFVAYSLEEPPMFKTEGMGSFVHAQSLNEKGVNVELMICLEMLGFYSDELRSQKFPIPGLSLLYPSVGNFVAIVGKLSDAFLLHRLRKSFAVNSDMVACYLPMPEIEGISDESDHLNYWNFGFRAVMVTNTGYFRNPNYHKKSDTPETLSYEKMAMVVSGLVGLVQDL